MRGDCVGIEDVDQEDRRARADHVVKPAFIYRHQWRHGDLLMWDNCARSSTVPSRITTCRSGD
jgi:alpha-ketoglutarate-dependent taurine dioxygenase